MNAPIQYQLSGQGASAIADSVETGAREGRIPPGALLPTVRDLAATLRVSPTTVAAAYRLLKSRGLVTARGRRGTRVAPRPALPMRSAPPLPAGLRDLASGNPDPSQLPPAGPALRTVDPRPRMYGGATKRAALVALAAAALRDDAIDSRSLAVVGGALEGIERVLQAHLRPGDRVGVEDPGYTGVLDLLGALGLVPEPIAMDDSGPLAAELARVVRSGVGAVIFTPRAQNPTGAAIDPRRGRELRRVLDLDPDVLVVEDDHAGSVAGATMVTLTQRRVRWAVVRSVSKWLGPDLRLAVVAADAVTLGRVEGRQLLGTGWVSHVLQQVVTALWSEAMRDGRLAKTTEIYARRRAALLAALARRGIAAHGRSGLNVWIPVGEELSTIAGLAAAGWAVRGGERYRLRTPPAIRVTIADLQPRDAERFAADLERVLRPEATMPLA